MRRRVSPKFKGTSAVPAPVDPNPLTGAKFWVEPGNSSATYAASIRSTNPARAAVIDKIGTNPVAQWIYPTAANAATYIDALIDPVAAAGSMPVFVLYQIPYRDVGAGLSAGGLTSKANYDSMIDGLATGIAGRACTIVLEPDALAELDHLGTEHGATARAERVAMLSRAVTVLTGAGATVYIDAGNPNFPAGTTGAEVAGLLQECNLATARGFALNVSNFYTTADSMTRGDSIVAALGSAGVGKGYVIDTSRNGNGRGSTWCNPSGRALGEVSTTSTASAACDAYLWIKTPGRSDGNADICGIGAPAAGQYWADYAYELANNAGSRVQAAS